MKRLVKGTRKGDRPDLIVWRDNPGGHTLQLVLSWAGWAGFAAALVKCITLTPHP